MFAIEGQGQDDMVKLNVDDLRWVENVRNAVGGLAAQADLQCEGCEVPWLAIHYSLESIRDSLTAIVEDYKSRLGIKDGRVKNDRL